MNDNEKRLLDWKFNIAKCKGFVQKKSINYDLICNG